MVAFILVCFVLTWVSTLIGCLSFTSPLSIHRQSNGYKRPLHTNRPLPWSSTHSSTNLISATITTTTTLRLDTTTTGDISTTANAVAVADNGDNKVDNNVGLYIHIPYCRQRCRYCDFAIVPIGDHRTTANTTNSSINSRGENNNNDVDNVVHDDDRDGGQLGRREEGFRRMDERYVSAVVAELKQIATENSAKNRPKIPLKSVYFGGGTPSLAPVESIEKILYHVCGPDNPEAPFRLLQHRNDEDGHATTTTTSTISTSTSTTEITMEMDPGTFDRDQLCALRTLGINRISLGVQSFDDDLLCAMGRTHRRIDVLQAIRDIASVFGNDGDYDKVNYSIDLISGCPGLTLAKWVETLEEATAGVRTKKMTSTVATTDDFISKTTTTTTTTKNEQSLLLSSLPPPKHISVYDMQIEDGTVFGNLATKAKAAAATKRKEGDQTTQYNEDDDDDASRQFTVAVPIDDGKEDDGVLPRRLDQRQKQKTSQQRLLRLPTEEECAFMYKYAAGYLRAKNYEHYEVSSYAAFDDNAKHKKSKDDDDDDGSNKPPIGSTSRRSRHNQIYWEYDGQWYAVGLGATSFVNKKLVARPREMSNYLDWVVGRENSTTSTDDTEDNDDDDNDDDFLSDLLLKRLRTTDGLDLTWLETTYGSKVVKNVMDGAKLGLELGLAERTNDNALRLTDPDGLLYSNFIISSIFVELGYT